MYNVTQKFKDYSSNPNRELDAKVEINDVAYLRNSIVEMEVEDSIISDEDFEIGSAVVSSMTLQIKTSDLIPKNAKIEPFVRFSVAGDYTEWLPLGEFYIDSRVKQGGIWNLSCFSKLIVAQQTYHTDLLFPNTMAQVMTELLYNLGLELDLNTTIDTAYTIDTNPVDSMFTFRDVIRFIAISHGKCARMNKDGKLEFTDISDVTPIHTITQAFSKSCKELNPLKTITKVVFNYNTNLEPIILGVGDEDATLWCHNPFITVPTADLVFALVQGLEYQPLSATIYSFPYLEVGDWVTVQHRDGSYDTIILRTRFSFKGGMSTIIESPSVTGSQSEFGFDGNTGQQIAEMGKRIGLFAHTTNTTKKTVKQTVVQIALIPLTTASETDIEFVVTLNGVASVDSILRVRFRIEGEDVGRIMRIPVKSGLDGNFISFSTLRAKIPKISNWVFLMMAVDSGNFVIESEECEFYIYGGNIVSGDVRPILEFEDEIGFITGISDSASTSTW